MVFLCDIKFMKVILLAAISTDGFIGTNAAHRSLDWRSKEDAAFFIAKTKEAGVIIMGAVTYKTFRLKRAPPGRRLIIYTRHPEEILGENVETTDEKPPELLKRLQAEGHESVVLGGGATINKLFVDEGLVDEMYLTVEPVLFGQGVNLLSGNVNTRLKLLSAEKLGADSVLLHYSLEDI